MHVGTFFEQVEKGSVPSVVELLGHVVAGEPAVGQALDVRFVEVYGRVNGKGGSLKPEMELNKWSTKSSNLAAALGVNNKFGHPDVQLKSDLDVDPRLGH